MARRSLLQKFIAVLVVLLGASIADGSECYRYFLFVHCTVPPIDGTLSIGDVGTSQECNKVWWVSSRCTPHPNGSQVWCQEEVAAVSGATLVSWSATSETSATTAESKVATFLSNANSGSACYEYDYNMGSWCNCDGGGCDPGSVVLTHSATGDAIGRDQAGNLVYSHCSTTAANQVALDQVTMFPGQSLPNCCDGGPDPPLPGSGCEGGRLRFDTAPPGVVVGQLTASGEDVYASCGDASHGSIPTSEVTFVDGYITLLPDCCDGSDAGPGGCSLGSVVLIAGTNEGVYIGSKPNGQHVRAKCGDPSESNVSWAEVNLVSDWEERLPNCCDAYGGNPPPDDTPQCEAGQITFLTGDVGIRIGVLQSDGTIVRARCMPQGTASIHPGEITFDSDYIGNLPTCCDGFGDNPTSPGIDPDDCQEVAYYWVGTSGGVIVGHSPDTGQPVHADCFAPGETPPPGAVTGHPDWIIHSVPDCDCNPATPIVTPDDGNGQCLPGVVAYSYTNDQNGTAVCSYGSLTVYSKCFSADAVPEGWFTQPREEWDCFDVVQCCNDVPPEYDCDSDGQDDRYQQPMPSCGDCDGNGSYDAYQDPMPDCATQPGNCCCDRPINVTVNIDGGNGIQLADPDDPYTEEDEGAFRSPDVPSDETLDIDEDWQRLRDRLDDYLPQGGFGSAIPTDLHLNFPVIGSVIFPMKPTLDSWLDNMRVTVRGVALYAFGLMMIGRTLSVTRRFL